MTLAENQENTEINQANYEATPYEDSSWEVVGELIETKEFAPLEIKVLPSTVNYADPMFADYGGIPKDCEILRWHLPEELTTEENLKRIKAESIPSVPMVEMTEVEFEACKQQAFEDGKQSGMAEAVSASAEKMTIIETRLLDLFNDLEKQIVENNISVEKKAVELAMHIAHKVIRQAVEINPEYIVPVIKEGLGLAGSAVVRKVRVSTQDLEFIQLLGLVKILRGRDQAWEFQADQSIHAGCVIETSAGEIDYQLDQAWERIKDQVVKVIK